MQRQRQQIYKTCPCHCTLEYWSRPPSFATCVDHGLYHCVGVRQIHFALLLIANCNIKPMVNAREDWLSTTYSCFSTALQDSWLLQFAHSCLQTTVDYPSCKWQHLLSPALSHKSTPQPKQKIASQFPLITISSHYLHQEIVCCCLLITNQASRLVFRNDLYLKWPPQSMYYA